MSILLGATPKPDVKFISRQSAVHKMNIHLVKIEETDNFLEKTVFIVG